MAWKSFGDTGCYFAQFNIIGAPAQPPTLKMLAVSTTIPTPSGGNFNEPSAGEYARISIAESSYWIDPLDHGQSIKDDSSTLYTLGVDIKFAMAVNAWGVIRAAGIFNEDNYLLWGAELETPVDIQAAMTLYFKGSSIWNNGNLKISMATT